MEFVRQPRLTPEYPKGQIEIEAPPSISAKPEVSWFSILVMPISAIAITVLVYTLGQSSGSGIGQNPVFIIGSAATTVLSIIGGLINYNHQTSKYRKQKHIREKKYKQYITEKDKELSFAAKQQETALKKTHPSPSACIGIMASREPRLWERTQAFDDFLNVRIGIGAEKMALRVSGTREPGVMETDPLAGEPNALALKYDNVQDVPLCVDLTTAQICGIAGKNDRVVDFINNMIIQLVTHQGYDDLRIVVLAKEDTIRKWSWIRFLPHVWNDEFNIRYLLCGKDMAQSTLTDLCAIFKAREKTSGNGIAGERYVFLIDDPSTLAESPIRKYIYEPSARIGVMAIFAAEQMSYLPASCGTVIILNEKNATMTDRVNSYKSVFTPDAAEYASNDSAARNIAPLRIRATVSHYTLPKSITLSQMLISAGLASGDFNSVDILGNWRKNKTYNGMSVPIGAKIGGGVFSLDIHETGHGPHGLVAGTTGSGKSELLQSIIISLSLTFHPYDVAFVLIDYKGGGMADVFKGMPHLAGVITNLGGRQTMRALLSIKGEIFRRQAKFAEYGVNNIDRYQRAYYRNENQNMTPIPHMVMIVDEFAELKQDQPEFMKELVSAARVGRSLGIHLILATQKPGGVVDDQIWSNSKFKLCLKVQTEADSNEVLKKPDSAFIKEPGRAYLQVGNDEIYEIFQSAYSGADYLPPDPKKVASNKDKNIYVLSLDGKPTLVYPFARSEKTPDDNKRPTQLEIMVERINNIAGESGIKHIPGLWMPPLQEKIYLNSLKGVETPPANTLLSACVALVDDPRGQRQFPLELDFSRDGNLLIYGAPGTGKTCLLRTICLSLALRYSPDNVNIYILDMNATGLKVFKKLPHCGGVLTIDEGTSVRQFNRFLFNTAETRKSLFESADAENYGEYIEKGKSLPAIIVMIDNYQGLAETYEDIDEQLQNMIREGFKYGIYFVVTSVSDYGIRYKMTINFKMVVAFQLIDKSSYSTLVGRTDGLEPEDYQGRGLVRLAAPFEMQALYPELLIDGKEIAVKDVIETIASKENRRAVPIPIMPEKISFNQINDKKGDGMAIGLADSDLSKVYLNFSEYTAFVITGDSGCGKSSLASVWLTNMKNTRVYVMDSNSLGLMNVTRMSYAVDLSEMDISSFLVDIENLINERRNALSKAKRSNDDMDNLLNSWEQIIFVFDKFSEFSENMDYEDFKDILIRIVTRERGLKIMIMALDTLDGFAGDYETVTKIIKKEQAGVLLGSIREQDLFDARLPYGVVEKEISFGDGYLIKKTKSIGFKAAFL